MKLPIRTLQLGEQRLKSIKTKPDFGFKRDYKKLKETDC